jgi:hypothetical protein
MVTVAAKGLLSERSSPKTLREREETAKMLERKGEISALEVRNEGLLHVEQKFDLAVFVLKQKENTPH